MSAGAFLRGDELEAKDSTALIARLLVSPCAAEGRRPRRTAPDEHGEGFGNYQRWAAHTARRNLRTGGFKTLAKSGKFFRGLPL